MDTGRYCGVRLHRAGDGAVIRSFLLGLVLGYVVVAVTAAIWPV